MGDELCTVCGLPIAVGEYPCIATVRPHGRSVQSTAFAAYYDDGLGTYVTSLGQRHQLMREAHFDYREKMRPGDLSARQDRVQERRKQQTCGNEQPSQ